MCFRQSNSNTLTLSCIYFPLIHQPHTPPGSTLIRSRSQLREDYNPNAKAFFVIPLRKKRTVDFLSLSAFSSISASQRIALVFYPVYFDSRSSSESSKGNSYPAVELYCYCDHSPLPPPVVLFCCVDMIDVPQLLLVTTTTFVLSLKLISSIALNVRETERRE